MYPTLREIKEKGVIKRVLEKLIHKRRGIEEDRKNNFWYKKGDMTVKVMAFKGGPMSDQG
jgi:hypothetical protein